MVEGKETTEVDESRCDKALRPFEINYCRLPCPGHCVVTNWSAWSQCTQVNIRQGRLLLLLLLLLLLFYYYYYYYYKQR